MDVVETATTTAAPLAVWAALTAVADLPHWTASMTSVEPLDGAPLALGRRYRIRQPGQPALVWRVTELTEGSSFSWAASSPGLRTVGSHRVSVDPDGRTVITLTLSQTGPLAGLVGRLTGARTRRYVALEAAGIVAAAESTIGA